jgi:hypothetical protein
MPTKILALVSVACLIFFLEGYPWRSPLVTSRIYRPRTPVSICQSQPTGSSAQPLFLSLPLFALPQ